MAFAHLNVPGPRLVMAALATALILVFTDPCDADTIAVDGKTYQDVYIDEGQSMYYVRVPSMGETLSVRKSTVDPDDVSLSTDTSERIELRRRWRNKRELKRSSEVQDSDRESQSLSAEVRARVRGKLFDPETPQPEEAGPPAPAKAGNRPLHGGNDTHGVFLSKRGVLTFTSRPERYRDDWEYIEVDFQFERVSVPKKYRPRPDSAPQADDYTDSSIRELVSHYSHVHDLDPNLVLAVIKQESNFVANAKSHAGACGLMQLMPGTAAEMGVDDIFDPAENIAAGTQYLAKMFELFKDRDKALAAYNAGPGRVKQYGGIPPFTETQDYIRRVNRYHKQYDRASAGISYKPGEPNTVSEPGATKTPYAVHLKNGWIQPAEEIGETDSHYFVTIDGKMVQIRKDLVRNVTQTDPA